MHIEFSVIISFVQTAVCNSQQCHMLWLFFAIPERLKDRKNKNTFLLILIALQKIVFNLMQP